MGLLVLAGPAFPFRIRTQLKQAPHLHHAAVGGTAAHPSIHLSPKFLEIRIKNRPASWVEKISIFESSNLKFLNIRKSHSTKSKIPLDIPTRRRAWLWPHQKHKVYFYNIPMFADTSNCKRKASMCVSGYHATVCNNICRKLA